MIIFHPRQSDCTRHACKNEKSVTFNFTSQIASSICTVAFTKCEKFDAMFLSRSAVACHWFVFLDRCKPYPLSRQGFCGSLTARRNLRGVPRDGRAMAANQPASHPARCLARFRIFARQLPGCGKCNTAECPRDCLQDNSQDGAQRSRNSRVAVRATADATSRETSRKVTARNSVITISNLTPKNYELITINTQS